MRVESLMDNFFLLNARPPLKEKKKRGAAENKSDNGLDRKEERRRTMKRVRALPFSYFFINTFTAIAS